MPSEGRNQGHDNVTKPILASLLSVGELVSHLCFDSLRVDHGVDFGYDYYRNAMSSEKAQSQTSMPFTVYYFFDSFLSSNCSHFLLSWWTDFEITLRFVLKPSSMPRWPQMREADTKRRFSTGNQASGAVVHRSNSRQSWLANLPAFAWVLPICVTWQSADLVFSWT